MIRWITDYLGTAAWENRGDITGLHLIDVRELVDKSGNTPMAISAKIDGALEHLKRGEKVVVCCDYGMSRSNAIAAGILASHLGIGMREATRRVVAATGGMGMRIEVLSAVRKALGEEKAVGGGIHHGRSRLLVTGGGGFIGSSVVGLLRAGHNVLAPGRNEIDLARDVVALDLMVQDNGIDTILHLAQPGAYATNESFAASLLMLKNVLDVCAENRVLLVFLSNWEVYSGYDAGEVRADESLAPRPGGTYGQAKLLSEVLIDDYCNQRGVSRTILRSSPVYGMNGRRPRFIWNFLEKALRNEEIVTHRYLNGLPALDLLYVDDLSAAIVAAVERREEGAFNVGTGVGTSTRRVAEMIVGQVGSSSKIRQIEIDRSVGNIVMDARRAATVLGWHPSTNLEQGLSALVDKVTAASPSNT